MSDKKRQVASWLSMKPCFKESQISTGDNSYFEEKNLNLFSDQCQLEH